MVEGKSPGSRKPNNLIHFHFPVEYASLDLTKQIWSHITSLINNFFFGNALQICRSEVFFFSLNKSRELAFLNVILI